MFSYKLRRTHSRSSSMWFRCQVLFPRATSQASISQALQAVVWAERALRLGWGRGAECYNSYNRLGGRALRLGQTWKVAAWEITHLGSCYLGKYYWEVADWKNVFGKVPNINFPKS